MAPTLRSSGQNSPISKSSSNKSEQTSDDTPSRNTTPTNTPRKVPHCTKCGRPRAGHPRQGCPYSDSPQSLTTTETESSAIRTPSPTKKRIILKPSGRGTPNISDALETLHIEQTSPIRATPSRDDATRSAIRTRRASAQHELHASESLNSLSTASSEILGKLTFPPDSGETPTDDEQESNIEKTLNEKIVRWQDTIVIEAAKKSSPVTKEKKTNGRPRPSMPGTLMTPSPYSSLQTADLSATEEAQRSKSFTSEPESLDPSLNNAEELPQSHSSSGNTVVPITHARPLARSMSMEERAAFIDFLHNTPKAAQVYRLPKPDIPAIQQSAVKSGYFSRVVDIVNNDSKGKVDEGYLILGRDETAVRRLMRSVYFDERTKKGDGKAVLSAAAGGAVVGAVATFTGLAFS